MKMLNMIQNDRTEAISVIYTGSNKSAGVRLIRRTAARKELLTEAYTSASTSFSIFSYSSSFSPPSSSILASPSFSFGFRFFIPGQIMTQLVGLFVDAACPSSSLDATNIYGIECSSLKPGRCEIMSIGLISAARIRILVRVRSVMSYNFTGCKSGPYPFSPFRIPFTTSFTPRFTCLHLDAIYDKRCISNTTPSILCFGRTHPV